MTELRPCPQCGARSPPERYERSKGFHRFRVGCPHYSVTGRTRDSTDSSWNRFMERENRRYGIVLVKAREKYDREDARAWRLVVPEPLPCPRCGNPPDVRQSFDDIWFIAGSIRYMHCHCRACNYDAPSATTETMAVERWNEYVRENSEEAKE